MFQRLHLTFFLLLISPLYSTTTIDEMTIEEKIGQVLLVHFRGEEANDEAQKLIQELHVGGFIYYNWANGLNSPEQVSRLSTGLQKLAEKQTHPIPLFIVADQENGLVARVKGLTTFPGNKALGMTGDPKLAELSAYITGKELETVGVNFNLSPVVDINNNPRNPIIGIRSFGDTAGIVIPYAENAILGYHKAGMITCLKHFPGHGDVETDSHEDLPIINKTKEQLEATELLPFKVLAADADSVMTAHILIPSIDSKNCATLSKKILDILRDDIGFNGVIIADSLVMEGVLKNSGSADEAAIQSFNAGCDIIMLGGSQLLGNNILRELTVDDVTRIHKFLVDAVASGRISMQRLDSSVARILALKERYNLTLSSQYPINSPESQRLAKRIATLATRTLQQHPLPTDFKANTIAVFAPSTLQDTIQQTGLLQIGQTTTPYYYNGLNPAESELSAAEAVAKKADQVMICTYNAWKNPNQIKLINRLIELGKPTTLIVLRDPLDAALFPKANTIISTFSPTVPSIQAAVVQLQTTKK